MAQLHPITMTIAGSDSGGGAGIQADLKTFHQFKCFGTSVITALTAQNTLTVSGVQLTDPDFVQQQFTTVFEDLPPQAIKTGMLGNAAIVEKVAESLQNTRKTTKIHEPGVVLENSLPVIIDPVMISASGHTLLEDAAIQIYQEKLLPLATVITPNLPEAEKILGHAISTAEERLEAASELAIKMNAWVILKGGHSDDSKSITDILSTPDGSALTSITKNRIPSHSTHGTGCTLSAALTALIAKHPGKITHEVMVTLTEEAIEFVNHAIQYAPGLGKGNGPLSFFV